MFSTSQTSPIPPFPIFSSRRYLPKTTRPCSMVGAGRRSHSSDRSLPDFGVASSESAESLPAAVAKGGIVDSAPGTVWRARTGVSSKDPDSGVFPRVETSGGIVGWLCAGSDLLIRGPGGLRGVRAICLQKRGLRDPCLNGLDSVVGNGNDTFLDWQNHLALTRRKVPFPKHYYR